ncbi:ribosome hibernation promotion factor [Streptacidiphilus neutrinimicus]|uniref:ribosome hibernation promotion factor n=1 Tax=Streptacidiphilus neutrinimicus TaxID=105420 RepID=UPI0005A7AAD6|nr:HPF/RaiA family ribosome-associated protein [Streptacidiphilus neutrinimicus]
MAKTPVKRPGPEIQVEVQGDLPPGTAERARAKVQAVLDEISDPVLYVRIRLSRMRNPSTERPCLAQASLDVNGRPARAHVAAATMTEAVDLLRDRLTLQVGRLRRHWEARRGALPTPGEHEWRHGEEPARRPEHFPRPPEEREVVRHKSFALAQETADEAAFEMDSMDYAFHLFTDLATGEDSVIYRTGSHGYRLAQVHPEPRLGPVVAPLTVSPTAAPVLDLPAAKKRLDITGLPFVFFADAQTGRGNILYHRYDGHYGLIAPAG